MSGLRFYVGLHHPADAKHFERVCLSINVMRTRKSMLPVGGKAMVDSGAFTELKDHGHYRYSVSEYASSLRRITSLLPIEFAVSQDYMCEKLILKRTGMTVAEHQRLTIERYDALVSEGLTVPILPVLQGSRPIEYADHLRQYGDRLRHGMRVGVGSVCKLNASPERVVEVLWAVKAERPDLRLHGFGVKQTALAHAGVREMLYSADSMAWSFAARKEGRDGNSWHEARSFVDRIEKIASRPAAAWQPSFVL